MRGRSSAKLHRSSSLLLHTHKNRVDPNLKNQVPIFEGGVGLHHVCGERGTTAEHAEVAGSGQGLLGGVTWGASLLLGAGTLGFGVQQRIYTGLYVCRLQCVCVC